jgi:GDPmannose 4,6-dehydratase
MKAIIFGVTGQDGSHLADLLLEKDYTVIGVSRRCSVDNTERIKHLEGNDKFQLTEGDITDVHSVLNVLRSNDDVEEVYNLAAQSHVGISFKQPGLTWDITGKGCLNILQSMVDLNIKARFYQASSSEMYGSSHDIFKSKLKSIVTDEILHEEDIKYQDENTKFLPQSPYAIAKCAAHYMTRLYREAYGMHASAGILFNHEGPRRGDNFVTKKITKWIGEYTKWRTLHSQYPVKFCNKTDTILAYCYDDEDVKSSFPKLRLGNLDAFRDWGYAGDYVDAMWKMLQQDTPDDYVICTGETHTIREFLDVAFSISGVGNWEDCIVIDPEFYRPAEVDYLRGRNMKAKEKLGWEPKHSFEDLVRIMVEHENL